MQWAVLIASFLASAVEFVEAFTIVLVVGVTINWRSALVGALAAVATLALIVATLGVAIVRYVPIDILRLVVGIILILFGLKWLKKAILRYSGRKAIHDEEAIFEETRAELRARGEEIEPRFEPFGIALSYKAVLLEGLEVAFIVITFGSSSATNACNNTCGIGSAALGAALAGILVILAGVIIRAPLTKVPENTLKFIVGIMLTSFGTFWGGEGFGVSWPLSDAFIPVLAALYLLASFILVMILRQGKQRRVAEANVDQPALTTPEQEVLQ
ncbi:MAG: COG4280 domain-containing protein [Ktedonobacteraceae bacterium]